MKLEIYPMNVKVTYSSGDSKDNIVSLIKDTLDIAVDNYRFTYSFTHFGKIPYHHFYDEDNDMFATGLLDMVKKALDDNEVQYKVQDKRPSPLFKDEDVLDRPMTIGGRTTEGKYAYQKDAINSVIQSPDGKGILNLSVGSGKCLTVDTYLLTDTGYKTIRDILNDEGLKESSNESIHTANNTVLVNRYGENEKVDKITINGIKPINKIILNSGIYEEMTPNHPLLELRPSSDGFVWVKSSDIKVGDIIVTREDCRNFGTFKEDNKEAILKSDKIKEKYNLSTAYGLVFDEVSSIEFVGYKRTYDVSMPETHSFIANGIVNHNTLLFGGLAKIALPHVNNGEHILFFTSSKDIYKQTISELTGMLEQEIGYYGSGKFLDRPVMVVMLQSAYALLKIDPMKGVKLTPKERNLRYIKEYVLPRMKRTPHARTGLLAYTRFMRVNSKADEARKASLIELVDTTGSDKELMGILEDKVAEYKQRIDAKTKENQDKKDFIVNLLESAVFICQDECQHLTSDTYYQVLTSCKNALVSVGLSGSLNPEDDLLQQRVKAVFGRVTYRVRLEDNIKRGVSVPPIIHMLTVTEPKIHAADYVTVYKEGIVQNAFRNNMIADLVAKKAYPSGRVTLIVVSQIEHGKTLKSLLEERKVPVVFINGETDDDTRKAEIQKMRDGRNRVVIATSIFDEGIDVKSIKVLVMAAAGKSYRTTIQRIGRSVRLGDFNDAHVFDFWDNQHFYLARQSKERNDIYKGQGLEVLLNK